MTLAGREMPGGLALWAADDRGGLAAEARVDLET
jgi:hypothetical protein